jgi:predicted DNA-binding protein (MmcQ/YjbR family)
MNDINDIFSQREMNFQNLESFGFHQDKQHYFYSCDLLNGQFIMTVKITLHGEISTTLVDKFTKEDYILHRITSATGSFVGKVREEYEWVLINIAKKCSTLKVFKTKQANEIIKHIKKKYNSNLEFLWERFPENAIFRREDNDKWYGVILRVESKKLGNFDENTIEILDIKMTQDDIFALIDGHKYFPGYHMNKKHWATICLDGSVSIAEICMRIDNSFNLAGK